MKRFATWLGALALLAGCATVDYMGESHPPTTHVDVYYSESNVTRPYTVMGEVIGTGDFFVSTGELQEKIKRAAQKHGADAVVLTGLEQVESGQSSSWTEDQTQSKDKKGHVHTTTSGSSSTSIDEKKKIRAIFIRYTAPGETPASN